MDFAPSLKWSVNTWKSHPHGNGTPLQPPTRPEFSAVANCEALDGPTHHCLSADDPLKLLATMRASLIAIPLCNYTMSCDKWKEWLCLSCSTLVNCVFHGSWAQTSALNVLHIISASGVLRLYRWDGWGRVVGERANQVSALLIVCGVVGLWCAYTVWKKT